MRHRKILFLDIDGVLNTDSHMKENWAGRQVPDYSIYIQSELVGQLNRVMELVPDLEIVIHSSWGRILDRKTITAALKKKGFAYARSIYGLTPKKMSSEKVHELSAWLADHQSATEWLILDDQDVGFDFLGVRYARSKQLQIRPEPETGLTPELADKVIGFFND